MKQTFIRPVFLTLLATLALTTANAQFVVFNNGAEVSVRQGCIVNINTGDLNNDAGTIDNLGRITVDGDLVNNDLLTGGGGVTGTFSVSGNWENNAVFNADQCIVNLNGANQLVTGSVPSGFYHLNLLGTGVKRLDLDASVSGNLQLNDREFATDNNTLQILNTSSLAVTEVGGFVSSTGNGRMSWAMNSTDSYTFPLGSSLGTSRIRPLVITPNSASPNTFAARFVNNDATADGFNLADLSPDLCNINDLFYNQIDHVSGTDAADVTQHFVLADDGDWELGTHWQGLPQWEDMTGTTVGVSGVYNTITNSGWTNF
ncbi:MAG: hypothetical protein ACPG5W_07290, partial [Flavobacteriales bacterium]